MSRHTMSFCIALTFATVPAAQERVTTPSGRVVLLYPNGTWKYADSVPASKMAGERTRPATATARLDFLRGKGSLYYDPRKWNQQPADERGILQLEHTDGDVYGMVIAERLEMTIDALRDLVLTNAKSSAPDAEIVSQQTRRVNGREVMVVQMQGTMQSIRFVYLGYYYAGPEGAIQIVTYTGANLFAEYRPQMEQLLDGLIINP